MNRLVSSRLTERFEVVRRLGEGAMGIVYEAIDRTTSERVAVKVLRSFDADAQARFKREFRALSDVQHPNLVRLHELFDDDDLLFFTMDLVIGTDLITYVRAAGAAPSTGAGASDEGANDPTLDIHTLDDLPPTAGSMTRLSGARHAFDEERLRSVLGQLASAVSVLHANGFVHRDIKPSNIIVTDDGELRLLDFGLVTDPVRHGSTSEHIVGTAAYMSPEQSTGAVVGPLADWYCVGVLLFEALTGELPFSGGAPEVMVRKRLFDPPAPRAIVPGLPSDLDELCEALMRRDPRARPDARQIAATLGVEIAPRSSHVGPRSILRQRDRSFVGRTAEHAWLRERQACVARERAALAVTVRGDSGVGKSALVRHVLSELKEEGPVVVLEGRCYESESVHYKGIDGIVDQLTAVLRRLRPEDVLPLVPRHAAALIWQFPNFATVKELAHAPFVARPADPHAARTQALHALRELFSRLADRHAVIVSVDDVQWIDSDGWTVLQELVRGPDAPPLLLLMTLVPRSRGSLVTEAPLDCAEETLALGPLAIDDARHLAVEYATREGLDPETCGSDALADEAHGHPIFLYELVRHAALHPSPTSERPRLEDALRERIHGLAPSDRELLEVACIAGGPLRLRIAALVTGLDGLRAGAGAASLRAASFFFTSGAGPDSTIQPFHERVRATVVQALDAAQTTRWHSRIANALETVAPEEPEVIAMHWSRAGEADRAAPHATKAGHAAAGAFAFDRAAELFRVALAGTTDPAARHPLLVALGEALANGARGAESARAFLEAAAATTSTDDAFDLRRRAADQLLRSGHIDEGLTAIRGVLGEVSMRASSTPRGALASLLYHRARLALRGLAYRERAEASLSPMELRRIDVCWSIGSGLSLVDMIRGADFQTRSLLLALDAGEPQRLARSLAMEAAIAAGEGARGRTRRRAQELLAAAETIVARTDRPEPTAWLMLIRALIATQEGNFADAFRFASDAEVLFRDRCTGTAWELANARAFGLWALAAQGRFRELGERVPALLRDSRERRDRFGTMTLTIGPMHVVDLARDDTATMRNACNEALGSWSQSGFHFQHVCGLFTRAAADLYDGNADAAVEQLESSWSALERSLLLRAQFMRVDLWALRGRAALAATLRRGTKARSQLRRTVTTALARIENEKMTWSHGIALGLRAGLANADGDRAGAAALLGRAESAFERASMHMHAASALLQRGRLTGPGGDALVTEATALMEAQGVRKPWRFASVLVPATVGE